jgi:cytosine/adenosine deaminase-related metal-dependent hydrolase
MRAESFTLTARYVVPVDGPPIEGGRIVVSEGAIARVEPSRRGRVDLDLGNVAVLPGFVNSHTHLDLTPLPVHPDRDDGTEDEIRWLRRVVEHRRSAAPEAAQRAIERNIAASLAAGSTSLADITPAGASWEALSASPMRGVVFSEVLGLKRMRGIETNQAAWDWIASLGIGEDEPMRRLRPGLSPHAPYSTAGWLYERAAAGKLPLSTHLAEMPEELTLLSSRAGPLRSFLEDIGAWDDDWEPVGPSPADYLRQGELRRSDWLVAHGTYLNPDEFWGLRAPGDDDRRLAVAFCPRTHARFGHDPHPYREMLERGVIVCLGTDGLASSPTLSVLDEVRFLHARDPSLSGPLLLTMATLFGAWALRLDEFVGTLTPGKRADLAVVALPDRDTDDPHELILEGDGPVVATMIDGEFVARQEAKEEDK